MVFRTNAIVTNAHSSQQQVMAQACKNSNHDKVSYICAALNPTDSMERTHSMEENYGYSMKSS